MNSHRGKKNLKIKIESNNNRSNKSSNSTNEKYFELKVDSEKKESKKYIRNKKINCPKISKSDSTINSRSKKISLKKSKINEDEYFKKLIKYFNINCADNANSKSNITQENCLELLMNIKELNNSKNEKNVIIEKPKQIQYGKKLIIQKCLELIKSLSIYNKINYPSKSKQICKKFIEHEEGIINMYKNQEPLINAKIDIILGIMFNINKTDINDQIFFALDCTIISNPLNFIKFDLFTNLKDGNKVEKIFDKDLLDKHSNHQDIIGNFKSVIQFFFEEKKVDIKVIKKIINSFKDTKIYFLAFPKKLGGFTIHDKSIFLTSRIIEPFYDKYIFELNKNNLKFSELTIYEEQCEIAIFALESTIWHEYTHKLMKEYRLITTKECGAFILTEEKPLSKYSEISINEPGNYFDKLLLGNFYGKYTIEIADLYLNQLLELNEVSLNSNVFLIQRMKYMEESLKLKDKRKCVIPCKKDTSNKKGNKDSNFLFPGFCARYLSRNKLDDQYLDE